MIDQVLRLIVGGHTMCPYFFFFGFFTTTCCIRWWQRSVGDEIKRQHSNVITWNLSKNTFCFFKHSFEDQWTMDVRTVWFNRSTQSWQRHSERYKLSEEEKWKEWFNADMCLLLSSKVCFYPLTVLEMKNVVDLATLSFFVYFYRPYIENKNKKRNSFDTIWTCLLLSNAFEEHLSLF